MTELVDYLGQVPIATAIRFPEWLLSIFNFCVDWTHLPGRYPTITLNGRTYSAHTYVDAARDVRYDWWRIESQLGADDPYHVHSIGHCFHAELHSIGIIDPNNILEQFTVLLIYIDVEGLLSYLSHRQQQSTGVEQFPRSEHQRDLDRKAARQDAWELLHGPS